MLGLDLRAEFDTAFSMPEAPRLSPDRDYLEKQKGIVREVIAVTQGYAPVMAMLHKMREEGRDFDHSLRVSVGFPCLILASGRKYTRTDLVAGIAHDIGKLEVPEYILFKKESFTPEEETIMQKHNETTERLLKPFDRELRYLSVIASYHHPYNNNPPNTPAEIQEKGRLLRLVDTYDGMCSRRSYKGPLGPKSAEKTMIKLFPGKERLIELLLEHFPGKA